MVKTVASASTTSAAALLPQAAAANHSVFYDSNGDAKTVAQIYKSFADKIERQISQYSESTGTEPDEAAESLATKDETILPGGDGQSLGTMNVLALAALKLLSDPAGTDQAAQPPAATANRRRTTDTTA
jgi:hypothetical protein